MPGARTALFSRNQSGGMFAVQDFASHPGDIYFVHAGTGTDAAGNGQNPDSPVATIDYAVGLCTANKGDVIYCLPGHAETISSTSTTLDVAGITIVGLGNGLNRPVLTFNAAASTITVSAANVRVYNVDHIATFANVAAAYTLGAAKDCCIDTCTFRDTDSTHNFLSVVVTGATANAADGLKFVNNYQWSLVTTDGPTISVLGNLDRLVASDNYIDKAATNDAGHFMTVAALVLRGARIFRNQLNVVGSTGAAVAIFITGSSTTNTGMVALNFVTSLDTSAAILITATLNFAVHENYVSGVVAASGVLWPTADTVS